jgi:hypothetical protein
VTAVNDFGGFDTFAISITVNDQKPTSIAYPPTIYVQLYMGTPLSALSPVVMGGGPVTSYGLVAGELPPGIFIDSATGELYGNCTSDKVSSFNAQIAAFNSGGSATVNMSFSVLKPKPSLTTTTFTTTASTSASSTSPTLILSTV